MAPRDAWFGVDTEPDKAVVLVLAWTSEGFVRMRENTCTYIQIPVEVPLRLIFPWILHVVQKVARLTPLFVIDIQELVIREESQDAVRMPPHLSEVNFEAGLLLEPLGEIYPRLGRVQTSRLQREAVFAQVCPKTNPFGVLVDAFREIGYPIPT